MVPVDQGKENDSVRGCRAWTLSPAFQDSQDDSHQHLQPTMTIEDIDEYTLPKAQGGC